MAEAIKIMTPVGRLVQGHPMESNPVIDDNTKQPKKNQDGSDQVSFYMALAFSKADPAFMRDIWPQMSAAAQRDWPQGQFNSPTFAWKMIDGDGVDKEGKPYATREGFAGHYILKINSGYGYTVVNQVNGVITDAKLVKRGDYMRAYVGIKGNAPSKSPGLYINPDFVQLCGYGEEIRSGPDVAGVLSKVGGFVLPPGATASAVPSAPALLPAVGLPQVQQPAAYAPPQPVPGAVYAPNPGILMPPVR